MSVLTLYTGCRENELAEMQCVDVHHTHLNTPEAKSPAGRRDVPIHPLIAPTEIAARWGAVIASVVLLWDIYKWKKQGPRLVMR